MKIILAVILLLFVVVLLAWANTIYVARNQALRNAMLSAIVIGKPGTTLTNKQVLPPPVRRWLVNSGALEVGRPDWIDLRQELTLKLATDQKIGYPAPADQLFTLSPPAFHWAVTVRMNLLAKVYGYDAFIHRQAATHMKLWGLWPVASVEGNPKSDESALQRFLSEMVWYPRAALEPYVQWEAIDSLSSRATITLAGLTGSGIFHFTEEGNVRQFVAQRYQASRPTDERVEWVVDVEETGRLAGVTVPLRAKLTWRQATGPWTWLQLRSPICTTTP